MQKLLMRLARKVLENVLGQLTQQFNVVQEQALAPIRMIVQSVTDGMWKGDGADAFVQEVSSLMIPGVGKVGSNITSMNSKLQQARDIMDQADQAVSRIVSSKLEDVFNFY
jgi:hypothetical protein